MHDYYLRSEAGETRHTPVFVSALERPDRSPAWLEEKRRQEGKTRTLRNYPLSAEEAFAHASDPYFAAELVETAQQDALPPSPARKGVRYLKAWDLGRKNPSVCVVLRAPSKDEPQVWQVVGYERLVGEDFPAIRRAIEAMQPSPARKGDRYLKAWDIGRKDPSVCVVLRAPSQDEVQVLHVVAYERLVGEDFPVIQREIEAMHRQYPGPTIVEANSIGKPVIQNPPRRWSRRCSPRSVREPVTTPPVVA